MSVLFLKTSNTQHPEPSKTSVTPTRVTVTKPQTSTQPAVKETASPHSTAVGVVPSVSVCLGSILSQLPSQFFKKIGRYMRELRVGQIRRFTIFTDQQLLSIFRAGEVYPIVIHDTRHFSIALLRRCERISQEIARLCRQRAIV